MERYEIVNTRTFEVNYHCLSSGANYLKNPTHLSADQIRAIIEEARFLNDWNKSDDILVVKTQCLYPTDRLGYFIKGGRLAEIIG